MSVGVDAVGRVTVAPMVADDPIVTVIPDEIVVVADGPIALTIVVGGDPTVTLVSVIPVQALGAIDLTTLVMDDPSISFLEVLPMPAMFVEENQFLIPREGARKILELVMSRICSDLPAQLDLTLMLFQNNLVPDENTVFGDLVAATFSGYTPVVLNDAGDCAGFVQGPALGSDDEWRLFVDQQNFVANAATVPNNIFGAAIVDVTGTIILGIRRFPDAPVTLDESGDVVKVSGPLILLPQMTPQP